MKVLPIPLPYLHWLSQADYALPALERALSLSLFVAHINRKAEDMARLRRQVYRRPCPEFAVALLDSATRVFPKPAYERLEFLGDAVLGYILSLNLISINSGSIWHLRELEAIHSHGMPEHLLRLLCISNILVTKLGRTRRCFARANLCAFPFFPKNKGGSSVSTSRIQKVARVLVLMSMSLRPRKAMWWRQSSELASSMTDNSHVTTAGVPLRFASFSHCRCRLNRPRHPLRTNGTFPLKVSYSDHGE